jgi:hypothetical protein
MSMEDWSNDIGGKSEILEEKRIAVPLWTP